MDGVSSNSYASLGDPVNNETLTLVNKTNIPLVVAIDSRRRRTVDGYTSGYWRTESATLIPDESLTVEATDRESAYINVSGVSDRFTITHAQLFKRDKTSTINITEGNNNFIFVDTQLTARRSSHLYYPCIPCNCCACGIGMWFGCIPLPWCAMCRDDPNLWR